MANTYDTDVMDKIKELNNQDAIQGKKQVAIQGKDGSLSYINYDKKTNQYNVTTREGGSANLRSNNPGNIIATSGSEKWEGVIGTRVDPAGRKFLVFDSMEHGQNAARNLLNTPQYTNAPAQPSIGAEQGTIGAAIYKWAPPNENDTASYVANVEKITGLNKNTKMADLSSAQKEKVLSAIYNQEGNQDFKSTNSVYSGDGSQSFMGVELKDGNINDLKKKARDVRQQKIDEAKKNRERLQQSGVFNNNASSKAVKEFFSNSSNFTPNILDNFNNPTYHFQIWLIPGSELEGMVISNFMEESMFVGKHKYMIYDSTRTTTYGIDELNIDSTVGANPKTKKVFVTNFSFELREPNGCLFFDRLKSLIRNVGYMDHKQTIFFLKITFVGNPRDNSDRAGYNISSRIIPFIFTDVRTKITSSGSVHKIKCSIAPYGIGTSKEYFNFTKKAEYSGRYVSGSKGGFLNMVQATIDQMNRQAEENILQDLTKSGKLPDAKVFAVDCSEIFAIYNPNTDEGRKEIAKLKQFDFTKVSNQNLQADVPIDMNVIKNSGEAIIYESGKYVINPGTSLEKVLDDITCALNSNIQLAVTSKECVKVLNEIPSLYRWEPVVQYYGQILETRQKIYKVTFKLRRYFDPALILSNNSKPGNIEKQTEETFKLINSENGVSVEKKYEYIFTSRNLDILNLDIDMDMLWWVNSYENIAARSADNSTTAVNDNSYADALREEMETKQEYYDDGFQLNGQETSVTDYINSMAEQGMTPISNIPANATYQKSLSKAQKDLSPVSYLDLAVRTPIPETNAYNMYDPAVLKGDMIFSPSGMNKDAVKRNDVKAMSSFDQIYSAGNMIMIDLTIRGDPYWLNFNTDYYYSSPSFVFEMKTPTISDNSEFDDLTSTITTNTLWGLYEVIEIRHTFSKGLFTQKLKAKANLNIRFQV